MTFLFSGIFGIIGTIFGKIFNLIEMRMEFAAKERAALLEQAKIKLADTQRAQKVEANFTRRVVMLSFSAVFIFLIVYSVLVPESYVVVPTIKNEAFSMWRLIFGGGIDTGRLVFVELPLTVIISPFVDMFFLAWGFYFGSNGSLRWR